MKINQGDIFWIKIGDDIPHPHVVIQDDVLNNSRIETTVVCALTTNAKKANMPGNVILEVGEVGEGGLEKESIAEVGKVLSIDKSQLGEYIGKLEQKRILEIFAGMRFLQKSFFE